MHAFRVAWIKRGMNYEWHEFSRMNYKWREFSRMNSAGMNYEWRELRVAWIASGVNYEWHELRVAWIQPLPRDKAPTYYTKVVTYLTTKPQLNHTPQKAQKYWTQPPNILHPKSIRQGLACSTKLATFFSCHFQLLLLIWWLVPASIF